MLLITLTLNSNENYVPYSDENISNKTLYLYFINVRCWPCIALFAKKKIVDARQNIFIFISNSILNIMLEVNGLICFHLETIILLLCSFINFKHNGFKRANDMKSIATLNILCSLVFSWNKIKIIQCDAKKFFLLALNGAMKS